MKTIEALHSGLRLMKSNAVLQCGLRLMQSNEVLHCGLRLIKTNAVLRIKTKIALILEVFIQQVTVYTFHRLTMSLVISPIKQMQDFICLH
jgi:hypothetical protein